MPNINEEQAGKFHLGTMSARKAAERPFQDPPASASHAFVQERPALPAFKLLFARLFLAIGPFGRFLGPLLLRRFPLVFGPLLDLRWYRGFR
jgi:hypothetical protein